MDCGPAANHSYPEVQHSHPVMNSEFSGVVKTEANTELWSPHHSWFREHPSSTLVRDLLFPRRIHAASSGSRQHLGRRFRTEIQEKDLYAVRCPLYSLHQHLPFQI